MSADPKSVTVMRQRKPSRHPPVGPETLSEVVRDLRTSLGETQEVFAKRFHISRTYVTNVEGGTLLSEPLVDKLIDAFPEHEDRITKAYETSLSNRPQKPPKQQKTTFQRKVDRFISEGRFAYARRALTEELDKTRDDAERHWIHERLAVVLIALGLDDDANQALNVAIDCAVSAGLVDGELSSRERLASHLQIQADFQTAHTILDAGLMRYPNAAPLWLRKGKVHWYEQAYSLAYGALTTALKHSS